MMSLNQDVFKYVNAKEGEWSDSTMSTAYHKLCTIQAIGLDPEKLYEALTTSNYSRYTIQTYFVLARGFEEATRKTPKIRTWMKKNRLRFKHSYPKKTSLMSEDQFMRFIDLCPTDDLYNFLVLMGKGGLRKSEALKAKWRDIREDGTLEIIGKGMKQRFVPFNMGWLKTSRFTTILPPDFVYWKFFNENCEGFTPHDFRAYYANKIVNSPGMSIHDARDLLGHESIITTVKYLRADKERQKKLVLEMFK